MSLRLLLDLVSSAQAKLCDLPITTCIPLLRHELLIHDIQHAVCRSPVGYLTERVDAGCTPGPLALHSRTRQQGSHYTALSVTSCD